MEQIVNGHRAYTYTGGKSFDAALPTAVFIHGAQNDHSVWALQTRYFAHHGFSVLAVDLPGHGRSEGEPMESVEALSDWLRALLDAAGVRKTILIGHSMGSLIALETAARAPEKVNGVALVGTAYPMKVSSALLEAARDHEQRAIDMVNIWSHSGIAQKPSAPGPGFYVQGGSRRLCSTFHVVILPKFFIRIFQHVMLMKVAKPPPQRCTALRCLYSEKKT